MSYNASWQVSGTKLEDSATALTKAVNSITSTKALKKYESKLNKSFQENIRANLRRSGLEADNFDDVFFLEISRKRRKCKKHRGQSSFFTFYRTEKTSVV